MVLNNHLTTVTFTIDVAVKYVKPDVYQARQFELHGLEASINYNPRSLLYD
jgi:hypothetical protein